MAHPSETMCGIFHFRLRLAFIKVENFAQQKHGLFNFKTS